MRMAKRCPPSAVVSTKFQRTMALHHPNTFQRKSHEQYCSCFPQKK